MEKKIMQQEAVRRLEELELPGKVIDDFKSGILWQSNPDGSLSMVTDMDTVWDLEKRGYIVYHILKTKENILTAFFYVSNYEEDWDIEFSNSHSIAYVKNIHNTAMSEFGDVFYQKTGFGSIKYVG